MIRNVVSLGVILLSISFLCACGCIAQETESLLSITGEIVYVDIEGVFYGIVTPDGEQFLPLNLPDEFKQNGLLVDVTGFIDPDVMTIQMWGQPLRIETITVSNESSSVSDSWYEGKDGGLSAEAKNERTTLLLETASTLSTALNTLDEEVALVAADLKGKNLQNTDLMPYLENIVETNPAVYEASLLDRSGTIRAVFPDTYNDSIGIDISDQDQIAQILKNPIPELSDYKKTVEGNYAVILLYPVFSSSQAVTGYLSVLIDPDILIKGTLGTIASETDNTILVTESNGTILGSAGSDSLFPAEESEGLITLPEETASIITFHPAGYDVLVIGTNEPESTQASPVYWTSVVLHQVPWRVLVF